MFEMKRRMKGFSIVKSALLSMVIAVGIIILGATITALLIGTNVITLEASGYAVLLILLLSAFASVKTLISQSIIAPWLVVLLAMLSELAVIIGGKWVIGDRGVTSGIAQTALVLLAGSVAAVVIPLKKKSKRYGLKKRKW